MFVFITKDSVHEEFSYLALEPSEALQLLEAGPLPFAMGSGEGVTGTRRSRPGMAALERLLA